MRKEGKAILFYALYLCKICRSSAGILPNRILYLFDIFVLANLLIVLRIKKAIGEVNFLCLGASFLSLMLKIPPFSPHNFWYLRRLIIKYFPRIF